MNKTEYLREIEKINKKAEREIEQIHIKYALANNTIKIGDLITDRNNTIKVEKINAIIPFLRNLPECIYYGRKYTKKGLPTKKEGFDKIYQYNVKIINGEKV